MLSIMINYVSDKSRNFNMCASIVPFKPYIVKTHYKDQCTFVFICVCHKCYKEIKIIRFTQR